jgi:hypothetical protein
MPVGTHPHLLVMGASSHVAVPSPARLGARRGANKWLRSADHQLSGRVNAEGFKISYVYKRQNLPLGWSDISFRGWTLLEYFHVHGRDMYLRKFLAARRVRADLDWRRTLELAAKNQEASQGYGLR